MRDFSQYLVQTTLTYKSTVTYTKYVICQWMLYGDLSFSYVSRNI